MSYNKTYKLIRIATWSIGSVSLIVFYIWFEYLRPSPVSESLTSGINGTTEAQLFDSPQWKQARSHYANDNIRQSFYFDLVSQHIKKGMSYSDTIELLGKPEFLSLDKTFYYLLNADSEQAKYDYLIMKFDAQNQLVMYYKQTLAYPIKVY